jgi:pyridoxal phosphate enzyme (YggS family)
MPDISKNLHIVQERIARAAESAKRDPREITLVAAGKTFPPESLLAAYQAGVRHFGENRVEEAREKIPAVDARTDPAAPITWYMIGHLQRRKAKEALALFHVIQSVDSVRLAHTLDRRAGGRRKKIPVLLEVNIAGEETKSGFRLDVREVFFQAVGQILALEFVEVRGLMTIAPVVARWEEARPYFRQMRELRDELQTRFAPHAFPELSMGMTDDLEAAILEGATMIRIGRAIFGERAG